MKRVWGHALAVTAALAGASAAVPACVHDNATLFIRNALAQQLVTNGQECVYTPDPTQTFISSGVLDIAVRDNYQAVFLVGNQTVPRGDPQQPKAETSRITVEGAIVRVVDPISGKQVSSFTDYTSATIDPEQGTTPSFEPVFVTVLDPKTVQAYSAAASGAGGVGLVTYTRVFGHTLGGQYVESDEFAFPVDLCNGCLVAFAPQDILPNFPVQPNCQAARAMASGSSSTLPVPCNPGQDFMIDCSQCAGVPACDPGVTPGTAVVVDAGGG